jgi:energy-coupling factor transporter ATP-binding protein EcfA2
MTIRLDDVGFRYAGADRNAITGVTMDVPIGKLTFITGRLGAGCSTLLQILGGLVPRLSGGSFSGGVQVFDHDPGSEDGASALRGRVGLLLPSPWTQLSGMTFTVRDEVAFGPSNLGWPIERIWTSVDRALREFDLVHLAERDPVTLSGGELQRTVLAGLLAMEPDLLLLDEPTQELDPASADRVFATLATHSELTCVVATAEQDLALRHSDHTVVLDGGELIRQGHSAEVLRHPDVMRVGASSMIGSLFQGSDPEAVALTVHEAADRLAR